MQVIGLVAALLLLVYDLPLDVNDGPSANPNTLPLDDPEVPAANAVPDVSQKIDAIQVPGESSSHERKRGRDRISE